VNVWPPTEIVPTLCDPVVLAATVKATVPFPLPDGPVTEIHAAPLDAVQEQPVPAVTAKKPAPPPDTTAWLDGAIA
jgi:hypothetical protein